MIRALTYAIIYLLRRAAATDPGHVGSTTCPCKSCEHLDRITKASDADRVKRVMSVPDEDKL